MGWKNTKLFKEEELDRFVLKPFKLIIIELLIILMMKYSATISLALLLSTSLVNSNLIVDREIDTKHFAEGIPSVVKYTFYNTFGQ